MKSEQLKPPEHINWKSNIQKKRTLKHVLQAAIWTKNSRLYNVKLEPNTKCSYPAKLYRSHNKNKYQYGVAFFTNIGNTQILNGSFFAPRQKSTPLHGIHALHFDQTPSNTFRSALAQSEVHNTQWPWDVFQPTNW